MYFRFKEKLEDFLVEEVLETIPSGYGDAWYLFMEKQGLNTMDIVNHLMITLPLKREDIGIAGLKDKDGITRQWLTLYKKRIKSCGGEKEILKVLQEKCRILNTSRGEEPLMIGKNIGNRFTIRLRAKEPLPEEKKILLEEKLEKSKKIGFPNVFGIQRFGKGNKNYKKALKIFQEGKKYPDNYEVKFKLQSFGSMRFNEYIMKRRERQELLVNGDIMINSHNGFGTQVAYYESERLHHFDYRKCKGHYEKSDFFSPDFETFQSDYTSERWRVCGPVLGWNQLIAPKKTASYLLDQSLISESKFDEGALHISKRYHLYGFRRALWIKPTELERKRDERDLILHFSLPTGAYATSFLANILNDIDPQGCISNGLIIPRIANIEEN